MAVWRLSVYVWEAPPPTWLKLLEQTTSVTDAAVHVVHSAKGKLALLDNKLWQHALQAPVSCCAMLRYALRVSSHQQIAFIPDRHWLTPAWLHDFACTDKYVCASECTVHNCSCSRCCSSRSWLL